MPLLGYAGYLPFGLECAVIGGMLERLISKPKPSNRFVNITSRYMVMFFP
jgi:hypothetical protein